jgi:hypothetical protein
MAIGPGGRGLLTGAPFGIPGKPGCGRAWFMAPAVDKPFGIPLGTGPGMLELTPLAGTALVLRLGTPLGRGC